MRVARLNPDVVYGIPATQNTISPLWFNTNIWSRGVNGAIFALPLSDGAVLGALAAAGAHRLGTGPKPVRTRESPPLRGHSGDRSRGGTLGG